MAKAEWPQGTAIFTKADLWTGQFRDATKSLLPHTEIGPPGVYADKLILQKSDKVKLLQTGMKSGHSHLSITGEEAGHLWARGMLMAELRQEGRGLLLLSGPYSIQCGL